MFNNNTCAGGHTPVWRLPESRLDSSVIGRQKTQTRMSATARLTMK